MANSKKKREKRFISLLLFGLDDGSELQYGWKSRF
jgi:hypothetical protein